MPEQSKGSEELNVRGTCEEDRVIAAPPALEPAPAHEHTPAEPDEVRDIAYIAGVPQTFPEKDCLVPVLLWISLGVLKPTLDFLIFERACTLETTCLAQVLVEFKATNPPALLLLLGVEIELELHRHELVHERLQSVRKPLGRTSFVLDHLNDGCPKIEDSLPDADFFLATAHGYSPVKYTPATHRRFRIRILPEQLQENPASLLL